MSALPPNERALQAQNCVGYEVHVVWEKFGRIFTPTPIHLKLQSHAANPLPVWLEGNVFRIFYSSRDAQNRSSVGAVDIDIVTRETVERHVDPFFEHGAKGTFFADGVSIGNCYEATDGERYMLFMGWQNPRDGHWRGDIGRLRVTRENTLELAEDTPLICSDSLDPISLSYPWVMPREEGGFHMWYGSTLTWDAGNGEMLHILRYAFSEDGHRWQRNGDADVPHILGVAQAFSRPTVVGDRVRGYDMWFSYRNGSGETYRIGRARSDDALHWELQLDQAGIDVAAAGWDAEMIEYPFVLEHKGERYMLYNGNGYGKTGFGLAVWE